jgi:signal transduction histidine kinase
MGLPNSSSWISLPADAEPGERERLFFQHSGDGMILVRVERAPDGTARFRLQAENPAAAARLASLGQAADFQDRDIEQVFPPWLYKRALIHYSACAASGQARRYEIGQPNGGITHESIATPVMSADGRDVEYILVVMRDIAERVLQERKLNSALARAEEANRSKSEFFASMSHELRTPLNAILGFSELMENGIGGALNERHRQYIEYIRGSGQHLLRIISDILDLSKIEAGRFRLHEADVSLADLAEDCLHMVHEPARRKSLDIALTVAPGVPALTADPVRIKQVLLNLLSNAIKFTEKGRITLAVSYEAETGFILSVTDTGIGMTAEELNTAMEVFGQVEDAYTRHTDGTGLGLPITRHLAELHGGCLTLTSRKDEGTCATVTLPASRAIGRQSRVTD